MANHFKIGYVDVTEVLNDGVFKATFFDRRVGLSVTRANMPLLEYDQLLDSLQADPSVEWIKRLNAAPVGVSVG